MGAWLSTIFSALFGQKEVRILILGLDNAGKTTILYRLQTPDEPIGQTVPTIGFNVETLQYKNVKFQVWDLGGQTSSKFWFWPFLLCTSYCCFYSSVRPYWRCYFPNTDAIVFVVDSADAERLSIAREELLAMLEEEELKDAILLIFANKQDMENSLSAAKISEHLGLTTIRNRQWSIQEASATKGRGLFEGFDWLVTCIKGGQA